MIFTSPPLEFPLIFSPESEGGTQQWVTQNFSAKDSVGVADGDTDVAL